MTSKSELLSAFEDVTINSSSTSLDFSWPALTTTPKSIQIEAPSLALEFLVAISMTKVVIRGYYLEAAVKPDRTVGLGSVANVLRSENFLDKEVVAMKQVRSLSKGFTIGRNDFEDHLRRLCLELRILNHKPLREHPNIIKLLGVGLHEDCGHPSLSLALEYAESGNLKVFLNGAGEDLTTHTLVDFACQAAMGLEALHQALICHGDVKTSNCLVFKENDRWRIKVSDFSESVVAEQADDSFLSLQCRFGTRFLNAPELRRAATAGFCYLDIQSAISTDVYSFGILTWETLKRGRSYLDPSWYAQGNSNLDEDDMEAFLEDLAPDGLIRFAQDYVHRTIPDLSIVKLVSRVFVGTLHAYPIERKSIKTIRGYLEAGNAEERQGYLPENGAPASQQLKNWTSTRKTLLEFIDSGLHNETFSIENLPFEIQKNITMQLQAIAISKELPSQSRIHAALCVAECHTLGFGLESDTNMVLHWVLCAAELGSVKALAWYARLCSALHVKPIVNELTSQSLLLEEKLTQCAPEKYLGDRIRLQIQVMIEQLEESMPTNLEEGDQQLRPLAKVAIFNSWEPDDLFAIHVAALTGNNAAIKTLLLNPETVLLSSQGLNAIHIACIGGHLSTLKLLLEHGLHAHAGEANVPTPLHFCVCFGEDEACEAAGLLIQNGADPSVEVDEISWEYHDIRPIGNPLDWAIECRHRPLVQFLLRFEREPFGLAMVSRCFFWEIGEDIIEYLYRGNDPPPADSCMQSIWRPFALWIAHGPNYSEAIQNTARLCFEYDRRFDLSQAQNTNRDKLTFLINHARWDNDFVLIDAHLDLLSPAEVKRTDSDGHSALSAAIARAKDRRVWTNVIQKMVNLYKVEELEAEILAIHHGADPPSETFTMFYRHSPTTFHTYLFWTALHESVVGARVLLETGVRVNQCSAESNYETAFSCCGRERQSTDLYRLLLDYGGEVDPRDPTYCESILEHHLLRLEKDYDFLHIAMEKEKEAGRFAQSLHTAFDNAIDLRHEMLPNGTEYLLGSSFTAEVINERDSLGQTLIQKSARGLRLEPVKILLEAGADASIAFQAGTSEKPLLPLQMACMTGRSRIRHSFTQESEVYSKLKCLALPVAWELLQWHLSRCDGLFEGITKLHLAAYMFSEEDIQQLLEVGYDPLAKGEWPGIPFKVTPKDLCRANHDFNMGSPINSGSTPDKWSNIVPDPFWEVGGWDIDGIEDETIKKRLMSFDYDLTMERLRSIDNMLPG